MLIDFKPQVWMVHFSLEYVHRKERTWVASEIVVIVVSSVLVVGDIYRVRRFLTGVPWKMTNANPLQMARLRRNTNIASFAPLMVKKSLFIEFLREVLYKIMKPILKNGAISYLKMKKLNHRVKKWNAMLQIKHAIIPMTLNL